MYNETNKLIVWQKAHQLVLNIYMRLQRHENISTTRRYARTAPEAIMELAARADRVEETR